MAFITASDETTSNDFILFSDYINYLNDIKEGDLVRIFGKVERNKDKYSIIINKMEKI
jgi:DNA polymerase III alpha subunit